MTAVVGLVHKHRVYLGGDSAGVAGYQLTIRADPKVFLNGPYVMGFTSSFRMGQLLRHSLSAPHPEGDLNQFMCTRFVDAVRTCLKDGGWARKDAEQEEGGTFLVGIHGRLFTLDSDYQVAESADGYDAAGCGDQLALGSLHTTTARDMKPHQRLTAALDAAAHHSAGVRGPYSFAATPRPS
ncbi:hypothetical protein ACFTTN_21765 [Streptomyces niveus]|uniref:hypothetical protein n=1 Tax=Streptomyces niveus TaxID=193462 RepID=UPI0036284F05